MPAVIHFFKFHLSEFNKKYRFIGTTKYIQTPL